MEFKIQQKTTKGHQLYIIDDVKKLSQVPHLSEKEIEFAAAAFNAEQSLVTINHYVHYHFIYLLKPKKTDWQTSETIRKAGADIQATCNKLKLEELTIANLSAQADAAILFAEGIALSNYQFLK